MKSSKNNDCITKRDTYVIKDYGDSVVTVRDLQLCILEIMDEIDRVCRKNKIPYALHAGSALGVINYKGFIPWDDDIDVCIDKKDYKRFIEALKKDLSDDFVFQCFETDKKFNILIPQMKIRKKGTYLKEVNTLLRNKCKSGNGVCIDVIWMGNVSENKLIDQTYRTMIKLIMPFYVLLDNIGINPIPLKYLIEWISNGYSNRNEKSSLTSQSIRMCFEKFMHEPIFLKEDLYPFKDCEFEGRTYMSYSNPEKILHQWYGPNCTKKWDGKEWIETLPVAKRKPKHVVDLNLNSDKPYNKAN